MKTKLKLSDSQIQNSFKFGSPGYMATQLGISIEDVGILISGYEIEIEVDKVEMFSNNVLSSVAEEAMKKSIRDSLVGVSNRLRGGIKNGVSQEMSVAISEVLQIIQSEIGFYK